MPIDYLIDLERRLLICTVRGRLTGRDIFEIDDRVRTDPQMRPDFNQLSDFRLAADFAVKSDDIRDLAQRRPYFSSTSRRAVVGKGPLARGMTRMFELQRGDTAGQIRLFERLEDANRWLDEESLAD